MTPPCPKCGARPAHIQDGNYHCMMCCTDYRIIDGKYVILNKRTGEEVMPGIEKTKSGQKGTCVNCCRPDKFIADKNGLCTTCHSAIDGMESGSEEFTAALANVKERLTNPARKSTEAPRKAQALRNKVIKQLDHAKKINARRKSTLDMTIPEVVRTGIPGIIHRMHEERALFLAEADKLAKAINLLESI